MKKFWMVWNGEVNLLNLPRVRHPSFLDAQCEANRLARMNPGKTFYVLEGINATTRSDLWTVELT